MNESALTRFRRRLTPQQRPASCGFSSIVWRSPPPGGEGHPRAHPGDAITLCWGLIGLPTASPTGHLFTEPGGAEVAELEISSLAPDEDGEVCTFMLPANLSAGEYSLVVRGQSENGSVEFGCEVGFKVEA